MESSFIYEGKDGLRVDALEIVRIAREADAVILDVYSKEDDWDVSMKEGNEPLTRADKAAHNVINQSLLKLAPNIPVISEEGESVCWETRQHFEYYWCVDPLDGTKEFIKRNDQFTVNIALCRGASPVLGVVTIPVEGKVYFAVQGKGAYKMEYPSNALNKVSVPVPVPARIKVADFLMTDEGLTLIASRNHSTPVTTEYMSQFKNPKFMSLGSSIKFLLVAEGKAHIYPRLAPTREWDSCAAQVIVEEAGGVVEQHPGGTVAGTIGERVVYNKENVLNPFFIVYGNRQV
eukprot:Lankesteria_metandrocarpae@DN4488_c0_g1_i1.p1